MGGITSAIGGIFGGGSSQSSPSYVAPQGYIPQGSPSADKTWQATLASLQAANPYPTLIPSYNTYATQNINNPYAAGAQTAANTAGGTAGAVGGDLAGLAALYGNEASALSPFMSQILSTAFDPQNALYGQQLQKATDTANVANAQYGLTGQQAAGNLDQAINNFNIDWQSTQLGRALQGISGAQGLAGTQQGLGGAETAAGTGATTLQGQAGALPYSTYGQNIGNILQTLTGQGSFGAQNSTQMQNLMQLIIPYLNQGTGAVSVAGQNAGVNAGSTYLAGQGLGGLFSSLGGLGGIGSTLGNVIGSTGYTQALPWAADYGSYIGGGSGILGGASDALAALGFL